MHELSILPGTSKAETYRSLLPQISALIEGEPDPIANLANIAAALHTAFPNLWTGFYIVRNNELVLGPFQGPVACTRIAFNKGVCGTAWAENRTIVVPDVDAFPGHIACSSASRSEIVVPGRVNGEVRLVLDIDSPELNAFDETDALYLEQLMASAEKTVLTLLHP
ncbi:MAG: GAF domain-containing protein [Bacteroidota bacterium]